MTTIPKSKGGHFETLKEMNRRHAREFKQEASATTTECPDDCHFGDHDTPAAPERGDQPKLIDQLLDAAIYAEDIDRRVAARVRIVKMFDQHSTLIAQRERLLAFVKEFADKGCVCNGETCLQRKIHPCIRCRASELITERAGGRR